MRPAAGIIAEYNPFHLGHARQIAAIREILGLRPIREFDQWMERMGLSENGKLTSRAGDPTIFLEKGGRG